MQQQSAIVIGAGFGGIAAALRMRAKGYQVTLLDKGTQLGGRAQVFQRDGFTFDAGPTVVTAPFLFDELFELFQKKREDYVEFVPLEPWYRFVYPDNSHFDYGGTVEDTIAEIRRVAPEDEQGYLSLLKASEEIFDVGFTQLADEPFNEFSKMVKQIPHLLRLNSHKTVWQLVCKYLQSEKLRQAFSIQPLLVGGNPFDTTCIYNLIHFLEREWGIHFAMGGTGAIVNALEKLMREEGIEIITQAHVTGLTYQGQRVTGVDTADGEHFSADVVVSNMDPSHLYRKVIPQQKQHIMTRVKTATAKHSMGLFVLYFGTDKQYDDVVHHTIWLGKRYKPLLDDIFNKQILAEDFSLYLHRPTATDPSFAPKGCDSFYVLSPVPNMAAQIDWEKQGQEYADKVIAALEASIMPGLSQHLKVQFHMTPADFVEQYDTHLGTGFSIAPTLTQSAWFRYHNKAEGFDNLYLVGAGTHPGAGMPGVLCSAKVLDKLIPEVEGLADVG